MFPAAQLHRFVDQVFCWLGVPQDEAFLAADVLLAADRRGVDSHDVARMPVYVEALQRGATNPTPTVRVVRETASTAVLASRSRSPRAGPSTATDTPPWIRRQLGTVDSPVRGEPTHPVALGGRRHRTLFGAMRVDAFRRTMRATRPQPGTGGPILQPVLHSLHRIEGQLGIDL